MTEPKITTTTLRDGTRIVEQRDGVQRAMWVYAPGNLGENADGQIFTSRHDDGVVGIFFATGERKYRATGSMIGTKDSAFRALRRWILINADERVRAALVAQVEG